MVLFNIWPPSSLTVFLWFIVASSLFFLDELDEEVVEEVFKVAFRRTTPDFGLDFADVGLADAIVFFFQIKSLFSLFLHGSVAKTFHIKSQVN